jgi:hypothetical protein
LNHPITFSKAVCLFSIAHIFGGIIATLITHYHDRSWATGPGMIALSLPTTFIYFLGLWGLGRLLAPLLNVPSLVLAGFACAIYPTFCGVFPIYFLRAGLAIPFVAAQFGFLVLVAAVFSMLRNC